ncbi:spore coat protein YutH [Bacillus carboniphilus]|uniref:Spore coat protein YutH n=1 Tax=Bacillus carboniphilus TaxID=86663 RepID=A0ABY9JUF9_9BACI|nr:spore coat protein YutH [Bacillus carboniphilus]WLR41300.1 spore coat protein YutH [Bacillus carboniphilus]
MKKVIQEHYGMRVHEFFSISKYQAFRNERNLYLVVPLNMNDQELTELYYLSQYLYDHGDQRVTVFALTRNGQFGFRYEEENFALLKASLFDSRERETDPIGKELALFHQAGRQFPYHLQHISRIGQWKSLWEIRLEQLESFWKSKLHAKPIKSFDQLFVETFPYYIGLCENAIQYLVDTELDEQPQQVDSGTVCYQRFTDKTWSNEIPYKISTEWLFDHASRDLAEYTRQCFFKNRINECVEFLSSYEGVQKLSPFSWRLYYSRLLFPVHYFECVESYYLSSEEKRIHYENKLEHIVTKPTQYETFLSSMMKQIPLRNHQVQIPKLEWLNDGNP